MLFSKIYHLAFTSLLLITMYFHYVLTTMLKPGIRIYSHVYSLHDLIKLHISIIYHLTFISYLYMLCQISISVCGYIDIPFSYIHDTVRCTEPFYNGHLGTRHFKAFLLRFFSEVKNLFMAPVNLIN